MNQVVTKAIVLKRIKYQEADRIITLITPDKGKLTVLAKGVRKAKSRLAGSIELFGTSNITFISGRGEISTLISARLIKNYGNIVNDLNRTQTGYKILKLIDKSTDGSSGDGTYDLLESTLEFLNRPDIDLNIVKLWFEVQFLGHMGHTPHMGIEESSSTKKYNFNLEKMRFNQSDNGIYTENQIKILRLSRSNDPSKIARIVGVTDLIDKILQLTNLLMVRNGFESI